MSEDALEFEPLERHTLDLHASCRAEIERLKVQVQHHQSMEARALRRGDNAEAEVERLTQERQGWADLFAQNMATINAGVAEKDAEIEQLKAARGCLLSGPGRGDCEHFVGPTTETDEYGVPVGWCIVCWHHAEIERLRAEREAVLERLGEKQDEIERLRAALRRITDQGRVCSEFESCHHVACQSSYEAWSVADTALKGTTPEEANERALREFGRHKANSNDQA